MNAIAYDIHANTIIDPLNGASDLRAKTIRACASTSLQDDPVRILRAIRQAAAFDFKIELETRKALKEAEKQKARAANARKANARVKAKATQQPNGHAHCMSMILGSAGESIPVGDGELCLGTWQRVLFIELDRSRPRRWLCKVVGS